MRKKSIFLCLLLIMLIPSSLFAQRSTGRGSRVRNYELTVTCNVPNATVEVYSINSKDVNLNGSATFTATIAQGSYRIEVKAPNYIAQTRDIELNANSTEAFTLQPATGRVVILLTGDFLNMKHSNPRSQIQVYDNGTLLEGNGFQYDLRPGQHTIQIVSGGFMVQDTIQVQAGRTYRLEPVFRLELR